MTKTITVNGKIYKAREFDFNMVCDLQDMGIELGSSANQMPLIRAYVASCMGVSKEVAGKELESHIAKVGNIAEAFTEIATVMSEMIEDSGFFQTLNKTAEEDAPKGSKKKA